MLLFGGILKYWHSRISDNEIYFNWISLNDIMKVFSIKRHCLKAGVEKKLMDANAILVSRDIVGSMEEILLAAHLAKKSFEKRKNLARVPKYEFLLWLTGKKDIKSAIEKSRTADDPGLLLIIFSGSKEITHLLGSCADKPHLPEKADPLALERISLSRV